MGTKLHVSVIATVYNESKSIDRLLDSLCQQTRLPDEIIICDGGSKDDTVEAIERFLAAQHMDFPDVTILVEPGANISQGRNRAIKAAQGPIIAVTDAGVRLSDDWLAQLVQPWDESTEEADRPKAVAGFFVPDVEGVFQMAMAATVLPLTEEIDPDTFLPSSRSVAFIKSTWEQTGGYPEWLDYCEDLLFDFAINAQVPDQPTGFAWAPNARVYFRPRESLPTFWRQYYRYARGDGKADLWRKRHLARYATYLIILPALIGHAFFGYFGRWLGWAGLLAGVIMYCWRPWQRIDQLGQALTAKQRLQGRALVPVIRAVGDIAKMVGYPVGLWWRYRNRHRSELHWREKQ